MSYEQAKAAYAAFGVDTEAVLSALKNVPISLHCWQGDDVRGFDTDPKATYWDAGENMSVPECIAIKRIATFYWKLV